MWNCGDDFILFGLQELLKEVIGPFNPVAYNRNPELHAARVAHDKPLKVSIKGTDGEAWLKPYDFLSRIVWRFDNSWRPGSNAPIDYCFFAGTPEWLGGMVRPLVQSLLNSQLPIAYVAIGVFETSKDLSFDRLPALDQALLRKAGLITVRDEICQRLLQPVNPRLLPCTALFAAPYERLRGRNGRVKIALCTQGNAAKAHQRIDTDTFEYSVKLFRSLATRFDCTLVCHYVDELGPLQDRLGDCMPILYSYDARDYIGIYDRFDLTVTTRVHGAGLAASLGIPALVIAHSTRSGTTEGFLAERLNCATTPVKEVMDRIGTLSIAERSAALIEHKRTTRARYRALLQEFVGGSAGAAASRMTGQHQELSLRY